MNPKPRVAEYKKKVVKDFSKLLVEYPIVGAVNMEGLPTAQLQNMRAQLRDKVVLLMSKRRLMKIAIEDVKGKKPKIEELEPYMRGMPALLFTKENPFKLFKMLEKNKSPAPAKAGQTAPKDIVVKAGPTSFAPGPIIGELGAFGIKAGVDGGKIAIKEDKIVAKEGDIINDKLAAILTRLGIQPMEIGLDLTAVYEDGIIYTKKVLAVDESEYINKITTGHKWAFNLAFEAGYTTKDNIELFIQTAFKNSKGLAMESNFMADAVAKDLLEKAERQMLSIKKTANIPDMPKAEKPKEEKKEDKAEELVKQTKEAFSDGEIKKVPEEKKPSASDILDEIKQEEPKTEKVPTAHELAMKKQEKK